MYFLHPSFLEIDLEKYKADQNFLQKKNITFFEEKKRLGLNLPSSPHVFMAEQYTMNYISTINIATTRQIETFFIMDLSKQLRST